MNDYIVIAVSRQILEPPRILESFRDMETAEAFVDNLPCEKANNTILITCVKARYKLSRVKHLS